MEFLKSARRFKFIISQKKSRDNDYFIDRISHRFTTNLLILLIILATFRRFFFSPINCWVPAELSRYAAYMERYCWLKGTYYVDQTYDHNMLSIKAKTENILQYYQWVYLFLCIQAFLFYLPRLIWSYVTQTIYEHDLFNMIEAAQKYENYKCDKAKILKFLSAGLTNNFSSYMTRRQFKAADIVDKRINELDIKVEKENDQLLNNQKDESNSYLEVNQSSYLQTARLKFSNSLVTLTYIAIKFLYLFTALIQISMMNAFLSTKSHEYYGSQVFKSIISGNNELLNNTDSKIFPRIAVCDVRTIELGTHHTYTIQCVLTFNLFNERIYAFLWFWIFFVIVPLTTIDLISWLIKVFVRGSSYRYKFIKGRVKIYENIKSERQKFLLRLFTEYYLGTDGCFTLSLIENNSNAAVVSELIRDMWNQFKIEQKY